MESSVIPEWVRPLTQVTRDDLVRFGACFDGVKEWCEKHNIDATVMPVAELMHVDYVIASANLSGDGYGYGYGYGYGDGSGDGYGYGYGG